MAPGIPASSVTSCNLCLCAVLELLYSPFDPLNWTNLRFAIRATLTFSSDDRIFSAFARPWKVPSSADDLALHSRPSSEARPAAHTRYSLCKPSPERHAQRVANDSMPDEARRWVETWKSAGDALARVRAAELRELSEERSAELGLSFTFDPATTWRSPDKRDGQGLVEQQRYFMKHHEHPIRHRSGA